MKIARIIALLLVAVMALGIFAACADEPAPVDPNAPPKALKISEIYKDGVDFDAIQAEFGNGAKLYTSVEDYTALDGKTPEEKSGNLMYYLNDNVDPAKYVVYDIEAGRDILSVSVDDVDYISLSSYFIKVVTYEANGITEKTTLYNTKGEKLYEAFGDYSPSQIGYGGIYRIGNALYKVTFEEELVKLADVPMFFNASFDELYATSNGYVTISDDELIVYYDSQFNVTAEYLIPEYYSETSVSILNDGKAFITASIVEDIYGEDYDVIITDGVDALKFSSDYLIFNPQDGKLTEVTTLDGYVIDGYFMNSLTFADMPFDYNSIYADGMINIVTARKIENKRAKDSLPVILNIDNDGNVKGQLNTQVASQYDIPIPVGDYYMVSTHSTTYLLNRDGSVVKKFATGYLETYKFGYFDRYTKTVYNKNFEAVKDLSAYNISDYNETSIFYDNYDASGNKTYYVWSDAGEKAITLNSGEKFYSISELVSGEIFCVTTRIYNEQGSGYTTHYRYYNYQGTLLFESDYRYVSYLTADDFVIVYATGYVNEEYKTFYKKIK